MKTKQNSKLNLNLTATSKALIIAGVIAVVSLPVAANKYQKNHNSIYDYAKVVDVQPLIETYQVNQPVEQCWDERVQRNRYDDYNRYSRSNSNTPSILGAIIGGAIGNRFGHGDGRKIATLAGAVLGSSIGRDVKHSKKHQRSHNNQYGYNTVQRCELRDSYVTKEQVVGYDVTYKYRGNVFHTKMAQQPRDKIKVMITVNPV